MGHALDPGPGGEDDMSGKEDIPVWSVSQLNGAIKDLLEGTFLPVRVSGEISGLTIHHSGHVYLTLKDEQAQIHAVFFYGAEKCRGFNLENGVLVEAYGTISFYSPRGECQLTLRELTPLGTGDLQKRFEEMKKRLAAEGLFDPERKKQLPFVPRCIGIITSPGGAAIKDFIKVALQRFPPLRFRVYPALVQGKGAENLLAQGVDFFNRYPCADVILLTRGGGSLEDLWPFNEEVLARAIAASALPVVSAVGHEIDTTICDLVADVRAPTPTAAAEALLPDYHALWDDTENFLLRLNNSAELAFQRAQADLDRLLSAKAMMRPAQMLQERMQTIDYMVKDMESALFQSAKDAENALYNLKNQLDFLNPTKILSRGYAVLLDHDGKAMTSPDQAPDGSEMTAILAEGKLRVVSKGKITGSQA